MNHETPSDTPTPEPCDGDLAALLDALHYAADQHRDQRRKGALAVPYINHPIAVARLLASVGVTDVDVLRTAILHDTVEDTDATFDALEARFGPRTTGFVREVTDDKSLPKQRRKALQVEHAPTKSFGAALIKLADKTCNLRDIARSPPEHWPLERQQAYFDWARAVVEGLPPVNEALKAAFDDALRGRPTV